MTLEYYERLLKFLPYVPEKTDESKILAKAKELGVTFPQAMIEFYHYFGNCDEILDNIFFLKLENIFVFDGGIVFADFNGTYYGVTAGMQNKKPIQRVQYRPKGSDWWCETYNADSYFFNETFSAVSMRNRFVAYYKFKDENKFYNEILDKKFLYRFTTDERINQVRAKSCINRSGTVMGQYFSLLSELSVSAETKEELEKFISVTGWNLIIIDKYALSKPKKPKLKKVDIEVIDKCYRELTAYLPEPSERLDEAIIKAKAEELGVEFPQSLVSFYHYFGNCGRILETDFVFERLENIHISNDVIVVGYSSEGVTNFGFVIDELSDDEPCISEFADEKCLKETRLFGGNAFFFNAICFNMIFSMPSIVQTEKSDKYFFGRILNRKNIYSFSDIREMNKSFYMCACHDEENKILGCYVSDNMDTLYLGTYDDDTLNEFEKKTKNDFCRTIVKLITER